MKKILDFTDLIVWQKAHNLTISIYKITEEFPKHEIYSLTNQMRRSCVSIGSNIAEGFGRQNYKEKVHFYFIAQGSLIELKNQLIVSKDINYLSVENFEDLMSQSNETHKILQGLIKSTKSHLKS